ncbi:hypothetical protein ACP4OV_022982 [Aristida adscensionis]
MAYMGIVCKAMANMGFLFLRWQIQTDSKSSCIWVVKPKNGSPSATVHYASLSNREGKAAAIFAFQERGDLKLATLSPPRHSGAGLASDAWRGDRRAGVAGVAPVAAAGQAAGASGKKGGRSAAALPEPAVAASTGSGKTLAFVLPLLTAALQEAAITPAVPGDWRARSGWSSARRGSWRWCCCALAA